MSAGFIRLLDNYERSTGVAEQVTTEELAEMNLFLDAVLQTEVMKVHVITSFRSLTLLTPNFFHLFVSSVNVSHKHILHKLFCFPPTVSGWSFSYVLWF